MISLLGDKEALVKLGESVHQERLRRNLPQAHLAKIAGVSLPTYRKIEKGDGRIEFRHVVKVLAILGFAEALGDLVPLTPPGASDPAYAHMRVGLGVRQDSFCSESFRSKNWDKYLPLQIRYF